MSSYNSSRRYSNSRSYSSSSGRSRAQQHIREAEELSERLGGSDEDVKQYFFNLPQAQLNVILTEYGRKHNRPTKNGIPNAEQYARQTFQRWASGERKMSGKVAGRLFDLLPPKMPLSDKYRLIDKLWKRHSPRSNLYVHVGLDAHVNDFVGDIKEHLEKAVVSYTIPAPLEARFTWISSGDVSVKQQLLNHFLHQEHQLISQGLDAKMPILIENFRQFSQNTLRLSETITVGGHSVEILFDKTQNGVSVSKTRPASHYTSSSSGSGCFSVILVAMTLFGLCGFYMFR